jgi:hypothetical protein
MREPIDKGYSILGNDTNPEPGIRYTLPDGTKTIWLNEYVDGMVQAEQDRIVKLLEGRTNDSGSVLDETGNSIADLSDLIALIRGEL